MKRPRRSAAAPYAPLDEHGRIVVVTSDEMRRMDRMTIERGTPGETLMERAGAGAVEALVERFARPARRGVVLVAGKGNNGGDALVMARLLRAQRYPVTVFVSAPAAAFGGDARVHYLRWQRARGRVHELERVGLPALAGAIAGAGVVVDGLFGTGLRGTLDARSRAIVEAMNAAQVPIVAVDIPSGLDADSGVPLGAAVQAAMTVTFAYPKPGLLLYPGADLAGEVVVADVGIDPMAATEVGHRHCLLTPGAVAAELPQRAADTHKGTFGHVLVLAGARGKSGAGMLCGRAALRAGAGLATIAAPEPALGMVLARTPELMTEALPDEAGAWTFSVEACDRLAALLEGKDAVVVGPGIGVTPATRALVQWLIATSEAPIAIDADGLNCLAGHLDWLGARRAPIVLTPHPGEMARLASSPTAEVQADRIGCARGFAERHGVTVVLKGARTVVASPAGMVSINPSGNPGMASGGMGDALAGMTGSLLAQGLEASAAAEAAVYWHGAAGDRVAERRGEAGLLASDVIDELPPTLQAIQAGLFGDAHRD